MLRYLPFLLTLALSIYTFIDCLTTPEEDVRNLPKVVWAFIILLFSPIGPIAWLVVGRPRTRVAGPYQGVRGIRKLRPEPARYIPPDDNPEFLASLKKENERRKRHEEEMRRGSEHSGEQDGEPEDERKRD